MIAEGKHGVRPPDPGDDTYITDEGIRRAKGAWREVASPAMRDLLDAELAEERKPPAKGKGKRG